MNPFATLRFPPLLQPLYLALTQLQKFGRLHDCQFPRHRVLYYLNPLQFFLAQYHPPISTGVTDSLNSQWVTESLTISNATSA
jgi:hypothetical protein